MPNPGEDFPIIPHQNVGVDCCGCLVPEVHGDQVRLVCNECGAIVRTITRAQFDAGHIPEDLLPKTVTTARCPHRSAVQAFPEFSSIEAFVCRECGLGVAISALLSSRYLAVTAPRASDRECKRQLHYHGNVSTVPLVYQYTSEQANLVHFYEFYRSALLGHRYNAYKLAAARTKLQWTDLVASITSSSAIVSLAFWSSTPGKAIFTLMLVVSAVASIARSVFGWPAEADLRSRLCSSWLDLYMDMESVLAEIRANGHAGESGRAKMDLLQERFRRLNTLDPTKSDEPLVRRLQDEVELSIPSDSLWLPS